MKKTKRFLAMLLTLILCVGELSSTGLKVFAAGEEEDTQEAVTEEVTVEDIMEPEDPSDGAAFSKSISNTALGTSGLMSPKISESYFDNWEGSFVYYGKTRGDSSIKFRVLDKDSIDFHLTKHSMLLDCDEVLYKTAFHAGESRPGEGGLWYPMNGTTVI